jgi:murein DD-endopeptidase MepM/ murein hydrolase activator NlpD
MRDFASSRQRGSLPVILVVILILVAGVAGAAYYLRPRFEADPPEITLASNLDALGAASVVEVVVTDAGTGLKSVKATLSTAGGEQVLASEEYGQPVRDKKIVLDTSKLTGLKEGPAVLRVSARDASWWHTFKGNETVLEKQLTIDLTPPTLELVADDRYVNFGGVGILVYKTSADTATSGVKMGDYWFPGFPGQVKGHPDYFLVMFAHPYNVEANVRPVLVATDKAGNTKKMPVTYELKNVKYKKSTIEISDAFYQNKVLPLLRGAAPAEDTPKNIFIAVNKKVRKENEDKITEVTKKASPQILWKGAFSQLSNSKVEANFADQRTYTYKGEVFDTAFHLGYDLSVTKQYPVEAANSGVVAFTGDLGLYGNAVILDHGLGLFTLYGHLSSIDVKAGESINARQIIGKTGETGFAGGDHLHYGVYLDGVAILPVEWWDQKWIDDNITPKLAGQTGLEIAEMQSPKAQHKVAPHKRRR